MTPAEVSKVLTKCAAYDQRTIGMGDIAAWHEILHDTRLDDALDAVRRHYRDNAKRAMPADIRTHAADAKRDRQRAERQQPAARLALPPGKWEPQASTTAAPAYERTAGARAEARAAVAKAQVKAAAARKGFADAEAALDALDAKLAEMEPKP